MASKVYTICLVCGNVQVRTDIVTSFGNSAFVKLDRKLMCPKCHVLTPNIATKNMDNFKTLLDQSENPLAQKLKRHIR